MIGTWVDYSGGRPGGAALKAVGALGALRYVGVGGSDKRLTRAEYADLLAHGIDVLFVVELNTRDADGGAAAGKANAKAALANLKTITADLEPMTMGFMANDQNASSSTEVDYLAAAADVFGDEYIIGPYGFGAYLEACAKRDLCPIGWQAGPAPSRTGTADLATFWQRQGGLVHPADGPTSPTSRVIGGVSCDLNNQLMELPVALSAADRQSIIDGILDEPITRTGTGQSGKTSLRAIGAAVDSAWVMGRTVTAGVGEQVASISNALPTWAGKIIAAIPETGPQGTWTPEQIATVAQELGHDVLSNMLATLQASAATPPAAS